MKPRKLPINKILPMVMHIDLNSCFAIIEQQSNRLLRGKAIGVAAYDSPKGFVLAASYEAKRLGVKLGVNVAQAKEMCPGIVIVTPDPSKYREAHRRFKEILLRYTNDVVPKSIDEFVLNFSGSPAHRTFLANFKHCLHQDNLNDFQKVQKFTPVQGRTLENGSKSSRCSQTATPVILSLSKNLGLERGRSFDVAQDDKSGDTSSFARASFSKQDDGVEESRDSKLAVRDYGIPCPDCHEEWIRSVGMQIKRDISEGLGEAVTVNIGIGPNRFLAKLAAGLHKPNGMDLIDYRNTESTFKELELMDFPGINVRYNRRLREAGIDTPLQFIAADLNFLQKRVFKSIVGYYWYLRMRGYEIDNYESKQRSIGHQYALKKKTDSRDELARLLVKLCEKVGRRLRKDGIYANGIHLYLSFMNYQEMGARGNGFIGGENLESKRAWHKGRSSEVRLYSTEDIYKAVKKLLHEAEIYAAVRGMSITVYDLHPCDPEQLELFADPALQKRTGEQDTAFNQRRRISDALDHINNRYGEYVVTSGMMMDMRGEILDRIAFGRVRDL